jgi:hypothetical protein
MRIDHVIYGVSDLSAASRQFADEYGLGTVGGGDHREFGTRNTIVPVGEGQFIELMAVAEEGSRHPIAVALSAMIEEGNRPVAVCLRPENLDEVARRLSIDIMFAERHNPDGEVLRWRLAGVDAALGPARLPFFIDWQGAEASLDRQNAEAAHADGIEWVECGGDVEALMQWTGGQELPLRVVRGEPGPQAIGVRRGTDVLVIR